jgi:hypothetical protein
MLNFFDGKTGGPKGGQEKRPAVKNRQPLVFLF